ncbi:alkaline phosphatase D family protein [Armatimonas sp.]|uniref:alkaline phosphatase D family protein n=1 Tax=Armatimonas sp. TaxID=1872638 RepID=UPI003751F1C1
MSLFQSDWKGTRHWVGPEFWAAPLQDWSVENGEVVALTAKGRLLHLLTHALTEKPGAFTLSVTVRLDGTPAQPSAVRAGFAFALRGQLADFRHALWHYQHKLEAGIRADGKLFIGESLSAEVLDAKLPVALKLSVAVDGTATLTGTQGEKMASVAAKLDAAALHGNIALLAEAPRNQPEGNNQPIIRWRYSNWHVEGEKVGVFPKRTFGPLLWTQYTLSGGVLKLLALLPPLEKSDTQTVRLEALRNDRWEKLSDATVEPLASTALFRIPGWKASADTAYRVAYTWQGKDYLWEGTIRRDPVERESLTVGVLSCDHGYVFPQTRLTGMVAKQNPDLLCFLGDQIYENYGGFGIIRKPTDRATLDYLRKYWHFGWMWRELLKDRPSVILPDDHDVFQGNIWGQGGRPAPNGKQENGGYVMPPEWVGVVQRTQTAHLPDPVDPAPVAQGIGVYFTQLTYGGVDFAVIEDRKFKTGPDDAIPAALRQQGKSDPKALDAPGAQLLGERQERFLARWSKEPAPFKVVLSQTIFCHATTHSGPQLNPIKLDLDCNAWPQSGRQRALTALNPSVLMLAGDQHSGILLRHGMDNWDDGPLAFMVPGTANGWPRAWWPEGASITGRFTDSFGHKITVLAAANPEKGSNLLKEVGGTVPPDEVAHKKGSGYGIVRLNKKTREATFEMWRHGGGQFEGFPKTINVGEKRA